MSVDRPRRAAASAFFWLVLGLPAAGSGGQQGDMYQWATTPAIWQQRACELAKRNLTHAEWEQFLTVGGEAYRKTCSQWPEGE